MDLREEQEQHKVLHDFLDKYLKMVRAFRSGEETFNAPALLALMDLSKDDLVRLVDAHG